LLKTKAFTYECADCGRQTSVTAGRIMHSSKLPLTIWRDTAGAQNPSIDRRRRLLCALQGIGGSSAAILSREVFVRSFASRRQLGSYLGLTPSAYDSGSTSRCQGISKAGNSWARRILIEVDWFWRKYQPDSPLSRWYPPSYKSFSTFNWPICRYRRSTCASLVAPSAGTPPSKTLTAPSSSCFFQLWDLGRVHPEMHRQLGDGPVAPDCRHRHLSLERPLCFFRVRFMSCSRAIRPF
jgi:hypothetical protein